MDIDTAIMDELVALNQPLGVIGTLAEGSRPESATVYYAYDTALNLYFITKKSSRKYKNIERNPFVSFVITKENPARTIQIEGTAAPVGTPYDEQDIYEELQRLSRDHIKTPPLEELPSSDLVFMKITTDWVRFGEFTCMREKESDKFIETHLI